MLSSGKRPTFRLGSSEKDAKRLAKHIDELIDAQKAGDEIAAATRAWLSGRDKRAVKLPLAKCLFRHGLIGQLPNRFLETTPTAESQNEKPFLISDLANDFERTRLAGAQDSTKVLYAKAEQNLIDCFGNVPVDSLKVKDGRDFWAWLMTKGNRKTKKGLGENTAKQRLRFARTFWDMAIEDERISSNPFKFRGVSVTQSAAVKEYVTWKTINRVIDACSTAEWQLLFTMTRCIPMRIPTELKELTWSDVDWDENKILIHSPKTRKVGKHARLVPIFPELDTRLQSAFDSADDGEQYVFPLLRSHSNLGKIGSDICERAKVSCWSNFWNSIRASAETDLMDEFGLRRACMWSGNSAATAMKNYALVRNTDYDDTGVSQIKSDAKSDAVGDRIQRNPAEHQSKNPVNSKVHGVIVGDTGLEPVTSTL